MKLDNVSIQQADDVELLPNQLQNELQKNISTINISIERKRAEFISFDGENTVKPTGMKNKKNKDIIPNEFSPLGYSRKQIGIVFLGLMLGEILI